MHMRSDGHLDLGDGTRVTEGMGTPGYRGGLVDNPRGWWWALPRYPVSPMHYADRHPTEE